MIIPVFDELKTLLRKSGYSINYVSRKTGVGRETLTRWLDGETFCPRIDTMLRVAKFLENHDIVLTTQAAKMVRFYPAPAVRMSRHDVRMAMLRAQTDG